MSEAETRAEVEGGTGSLWFAEVWHAFRPLLIRFSVDFSIFAGLWCILWVAHKITHLLPLGTKFSEFLMGFHEVMVVLTFVWLSLEAIWDLITLKRRG